MTLPKYYYVNLSNSSEEEKHKVLCKYDCDNGTNYLSKHDINDLVYLKNAWLGSRECAGYSKFYLDKLIKFLIDHNEVAVELSPQDFLQENYKISKHLNVKQHMKTAAAYPFKLGFRAVKHQIRYWWLDPMWKIISNILMSIRYIVAIATLLSVSYCGYYIYVNYDKLLDIILSISVEFPEEIQKEKYNEHGS